MYCLKCGRMLPLLTRFCPKCGTAVTPGQRKKAMIQFWILMSLVLLMFILIGVSMYFNSTGKASEQTKHIIDLSLGFTILGVVLFSFVYLIIGYIRFIIRKPIKGLISLVIILSLVGVSFYFYLQGQEKIKFTLALPAIQENLNEVIVAKIMGDSIMAKKTIPGSSLVRTQMTAELAINRLELMSVPKTLEDYHQSVVAWSREVAKASEDEKSWSQLSTRPGDFKLKIGDSEAEELFKDSVGKISELKEFGDNAINTGNQSAMLYIAAKLITQEHWLNGIINSEKSGFLSLEKLATPAMALTFGENVPSVGEGCAIDVEYYKAKGITRCKQPSPTQTQTPAPTEQQPQQTQQQPQQQQLQPQQPLSGQTTQTQTQTQPTQQIIQPVSPDKQQPGQPQLDGQNQGAKNQDQANKPGGSSPAKPGQGPRKVCIGRGGISTGSSPTNVYCIEDTVQYLQEIEASAVGFAQGDKKAKDSWDGTWHNLEGIGVTVGQPSNNTANNNTTGYSPSVQNFYNGCQGKGGVVGGAGVVKSNLPTSESGYTCEYKVKDKNGADIPCWDFLTYSGGRYMGGNTGCEQKNLLPPVDAKKQEEKVAAAGGKWDGIYSTPAGTINCVGDFSQTIPIPAYSGSVYKNVLSTTQGPVVINGSLATWSMSVTNQQEEGVSVTVSEIDSFRFYQQGNVYGMSANYSANIIASKDGQVKTSVCNGTVAGVRQ